MVIVYFKFKRRHKLSHYQLCLVYLAVADLMCCLIGPVIKAMGIILNETWKDRDSMQIGHDISCSFIVEIGTLAASVSTWTLCAITYERFRNLNVVTMIIFIS